MISELTRRRLLGARPFIALVLLPLLTLAGSFVGETVAKTLGIMEQPFLNVFTYGNLLGLVGIFAGGVISWWMLPRLVDNQKLATSINTEPVQTKETFWFPGPIWGGLSLIVAPILLLVGVLLRVQYHYYFPQQLAAYAEQPVLLTASYSFFALGLLSLWPGFMLLVRRIGNKYSGWAMWAGMLAMVGLFVRLFHEGVNYQAFQLVHVQGLEAATRAITDSYTSWYAFYPLVYTDNFGWPVLGIGAYLSRTLGWLPSLLLAMMVAHSSGVLKGTDLNSVVLVSGLCFALVPLGIRVLRQSKQYLNRRLFIGSTIGVALMIFLFAYTAVQ